MVKNKLIIEPKTNVVRIPHPKTARLYNVFNVSMGMDNYSQLRSAYTFTNGEFIANAHDFCNVTMMAMCLIYLGYQDKYKSKLNDIYPELPRLPDKLAKFIFEDTRVLSFYRNKFPVQYKDFIAGKKNAYGPNEIHAVLSYGVNLFMDCGIVTMFSTSTPWTQLINDIIYEKKPVGISGKFANLDHIVTAVGVAYETLENGSRPGAYQQPDYIIIDDSYGETYNYDKFISGNDIWIPFANCIRDFKDINNSTHKYTHRFVRPDQSGL